MVDIYQHLRYFNRAEFSNPDKMSTELLLKLDWARHLSGKTLKVNSSYRANDARNHGKGLAVDLSCTTGTHRFILLNALLSVGFTRIGLYPAHVHVDVAKHPDQVIWVGNYSKESLS